MSHRTGFSLIEVLSVLVLVSLVAVSVTLRWGDMYRDVQHQAQIEKIIDVDFKARRHATGRHRICRLIFDLDKQSIRSSRWVDGVEKFVQHHLKGGTRISKIRSVSRVDSDNQIEITVSDLGATPTYALQLTHDDDFRWIVFAGRTGQSKIVEDGKEVDELFASLQSENAIR